MLLRVQLEPPLTERPHRPLNEWIEDAVATHEGALTRYTARLLGDVDLARDVVQDAFLKLWEADRGDLEQRLAPWLYTVCRNRALDLLRKEGRMKPMTDGRLACTRASDPRPDGGENAAGEVLPLLEQLPERQQEVIRLKFQCGLSYREIGEVMDLTVTHVGVLIHTGIKSIREKLGVVPSLDPSPPR